jgi:hypothetical protein
MKIQLESVAVPHSARIKSMAKFAPTCNFECASIRVLDEKILGLNHCRPQNAAQTGCRAIGVESKVGITLRQIRPLILFGILTRSLR